MIDDPVAALAEQTGGLADVAVDDRQGRQRYSHRRYASPPAGTVAVAGTRAAAGHRDFRPTSLCLGELRACLAPSA